MKINLNCLKFHYFKFDSNLHNLWCKKNCDSFFNDIILENKRSLKSAINKIKNLNDITKNDFSHFHQIDEYHSEKVIKIIKKCHKNLNSYLEQYLEESDDFNKLLFYQIELVKPIRLIFIKNNDEFIPLIFDLHHLIYE